MTALEQLARVTDPDVLRADLGTGGGELTRLLPDLPQRVGELPDPVPGDPDTERHRLHTAVADLLANVTRRHTMLLPIEDVHWADGPTLLLLRHLARSAGNARMLLLATFRDTGRHAGASYPRRWSSSGAWREVSVCRCLGLGRRGGRRIRPPSRRRRSRSGRRGACARDQRAHRRQRVSHDRAVADVEGNGALEIVNGTAKTRPSAVRALRAPTASVRSSASECPGSRRRPRRFSRRRALPGPSSTLDVVRRAAGLDERSLLEALDDGCAAE